MCCGAISGHNVKKQMHAVVRHEHVRAMVITPYLHYQKSPERSSHPKKMFETMGSARESLGVGILYAKRLNCVECELFAVNAPRNA